MSPRNGTAAPADLLERDAEIVHINAALASAVAGHGSMVAIEGPAGAGKTALLGVVRSRAIAAGADVRVARATELEGDFAFGGARQLLTDRRDLTQLDGAAATAVPVLAVGDDALAPPPAFAVLNGLTTYLKALAAETAVVLLIDDAQWLDAPTVRWLDHLRGHVHAMPVLVVITVREAAARRLDSPLHSLLGDARLEHWSLAPLSKRAVASLLTERLGAAPAPTLVTGCHEATAGNPFAVCELIASLDLDDGGLSHSAAPLGQRVPATIARSIRARLARLEPDAVRVAQALAILGDGAPLNRVAILAQLSGERTGLMIDQLASAELVAAARPLAFVHPLVRSAIEDDLELGRRSALHAAAAGQLANEGEDPEAIAAHLLRCDPMGHATTVTLMRAAAALALRRGAPDTAATYLRRAGTEPPPREDRVQVLHELGHAELLIRSPAAIRHLEDALAQAEDPVTRARVGLDLFDGMTFAGRWREALDLVEALRKALGDGDPVLGLGLEMCCVLTLIEHGAGADGPEVRRIERLGRTQPGARALLLVLALLKALRGGRRDEVEALVADGLEGDRFLADHSADSIPAVHAIDALIFVDALDPAARLAASLCDDAQARGLVLGAVAGATHRGLAALRAGSLAGAERDLRDALGTASEHALHFTLPFICAYLAESLAEQGRLHEAASVLAAVPEAFLAFSNAAGSTLLCTRGAIRLTLGQHAAAITDLRACGERMAEMGATNPIVAPWRSTLARALGPEARAEAEALIATELSLARHAGVARGVSVALRARARLHPDGGAIDMLEEAVSVLTASPAILERGKALAELGTALRRAGRSAEARDRLREALAVATRCGAASLAAATTTELHIAGARPRGPWLTGVRALTPSELRVARLAAQGLTNQQIAVELVITPKTVKHHLGAAYRKLEISTRTELDTGALTPAGGF